MKKYLFIFLLILACFVINVFPQGGGGIPKIQTHCPGSSRLYSNVTTLLSGDIRYIPCAGFASIFYGNVDFTNATVTGLVPGGSIIGGTGTANHVPRFTAASTIGDTPLTWNGTTYFFTDTPATATFTEALNPSSATAGIWHLGATNHFLLVDEAAGSTTFGVKDNGAITLTNQTADFTFLFDATSHIMQANLSASGQFRLASSANTASFRTDGVSTWLYQRTLTAAGTTGAQTINKPSGSVNFAAGASTLVVTNNTVAVTSFVFAQAQRADATCFVTSTTRAAGSFTITMSAPCTAETQVAFQVNN